VSDAIFICFGANEKSQRMFTCRGSFDDRVIASYPSFTWTIEIVHTLCTLCRRHMPGQAVRYSRALALIGRPDVISLAGGFPGETALGLDGTAGPARRAMAGATQCAISEGFDHTSFRATMPQGGMFSWAEVPTPGRCSRKPSNEGGICAGGSLLCRGTGAQPLGTLLCKRNNGANRRGHPAASRHPRGVEAYCRSRRFRRAAMTLLP
jgi:hypothetical protein